jgi:hypothetical protein
MRWSFVALNPYQPPQSIEPAAELAGPAVMQVRYGWGYSLGVGFAGLAMLTSAIRTHDFAPLASSLFFISGGCHLALAILVRRRVFFEVFEDRLEFLSPVFPRWRRAKTVKSIRSGSFLYRWMTKREDFKRFVAWREGQHG